MKKLATLVFAVLLTGTLCFAQAAGTTSTSQDTTKSDTSKKTKKAKKAKKSKKSDKGGESTAAPK